MNERRVMGKSYPRVDGPVKSSGRARYSQDSNLPGTLYGALLTSPHAHAKVNSVDTSAAASSPGVKAVHVISEPGTEIQWAGTEVAIVAAVTEEQALDAIRKIKVDYEVFSDHLVREENLQKAQSMNRAKPAGEVVTGDPDQAIKDAPVVSKGKYGIPVLTHACHESHGQVVAYDGKKVEYRPSTQAISNVGGDLAKGLEIDATNVHAHQDHMGGGFGSKFASDRWGVESAKLSQKAGGKPVKFHLDRRTELTIAGVRPSFFGNITIAGEKDGTITAWDSTTWATGGFGGGGLNANLAPYVFTKVPNKRINHSAISTNNGGARAWRAPNHPQLSYLTNAAIEDFAAKAKLDPYDVFMKNFAATDRGDVYSAQLKKAGEVVGWSSKWKARGTQKGAIREGFGIGVGTWGGMGHNVTARTTIHPDGAVDIEIGTQDLGTGTRTIILQTAAESLGLHMKDIRLKIGDNSYPPGGASGGSTTVGGVSAATRKSTLNAAEKLFEAVAESLGVAATDMVAKNGKVMAKGDSSKSLDWNAACKKLGVTPIEATGANNRRSPGGLIDQGVGGCQIAHVTIDTETGIVKLNKLVAVHDCGLIINPKTAESQVFGGVIMGICGALYEERVMDQMTGKFLNADMEFYKLAGIKDIGEIEVHLNITPEHDGRGVIGLGEPPAIPTIAAIGNAVSNAAGARVMIPATADHVLAALA
jgi:xanthine dehydrogenase YagR molybdenum-binding subunit